jgi:hypothetical protein
MHRRLSLGRWPGPRLVVTVVVCAALLEAVCRFGLGLGDPPLVTRDSQCGYRFAPSQSVERFGNNVSYDANSVRGNTAEHSVETCLKTLVIGDSVLNGGTLTDDRNTATGLLNGLELDFSGKPLAFLNLSAGSWAPPQQLAYLKAYGTLNVKLVVLVLSSHDALGPATGDTPPFPTLKPWTAAEELLLRYGLGVRRQLLGSDAKLGWKAPAAQVPEAVRKKSDPTAVSTWCLNEMITLCNKKQIAVAAVLWPTREESEKGEWDGTAATIRRVLDEQGTPTADLLSNVAATPGFSSRCYRDSIHPTEEGQRLIAGSILELTLDHLIQHSPSENR